MNIFKTPSVKDIPRHKWAIPVPEATHGLEHPGGDGDVTWLGQAESLLEKMGFEKAASGTGHHPRSFKSGSPADPPKHVAVWIHPAGAMLQVSSSIEGKISGMSLQMEIDAGVYGRSLVASSSGCGGAGSCEPQINGKSQYCKSWDWHSDALGTLCNILRSVQADGRLVPFTGWTAGEIHVCGAFPLEALVEIDPLAVAGKDETWIRQSLLEETRRAISRAYSRWPGLEDLAIDEMIQKSALDEHRVKSFSDRDWWKAENAMDYCRRALRADKIRWPNARTRATTEHWLRAVGSGDGSMISARDERLLAPGGGGARFATCLALEIGRDNGGQLLADFLDGMSDDHLRDWATSVDAQGNTPFGEMVFSMVTQSSRFLPRQQDILDLFNQVSERVGAHSCPLLIGGKRPWLVIEDAFEHATPQSRGRWEAVRYIKNLPALAAVLGKLEGLGCQDAALDVLAMESIDRLGRVNARIDDDDQMGISSMLPASTLAAISRAMMDKAVGRAGDGLRPSRL